MTGNELEQLGHIWVRKLISDENVCASNWGEQNCVYNYNKFYYFLGGSGRLEMEGDVFYPQPEELYLIPAGVRHSYSHDPIHPVYKCWCHFDLVIPGLRSLQYHRDTVRVFIARDRMVPLFRRMNQCRAADIPADVLMEKGLLLHIFYEYLSRVNASKLFVWDTPPFMQTMEQYLDDHLTDDINLRQMAQVVHLHPNYFIRIFKRYFHVPPMEYIQMKRLEYAASLMREHKDMTIEEVGYRCGFHDYRYFGRAFKKRYGITPSMYRTVSLGGTEPCAP